MVGVARMKHHYLCTNPSGKCPIAILDTDEPRPICPKCGGFMLRLYEFVAPQQPKVSDDS